jgi:hypothetical protein
MKEIFLKLFLHHTQVPGIVKYFCPLVASPGNIEKVESELVLMFMYKGVFGKF